MMNNEQPTSVSSGLYDYHLSRDGCHDVFFIEHSNGTTVMAIYFWDEPDTDEAAEAEAKAQSLVAALNMPGGWLEHDVVIQSTLRASRQIAAIWSVDDVQKVRPDLSDDQAWEALQRVEHCHDSDHGITWDTLRLTAEELFPETAAS